MILNSTPLGDQSNARSGQLLLV